MPRLYRFLPFLFLSAAALGQGADLTPATHQPPADSMRLPWPLGIGRAGQDSTAGRAFAPAPPFTTLLPVLTRVAGVQATPYSGAPGAWATVRIRGAANLNGDAQPLFVVDGVPVYNTDATPERWPRPANNNPLTPTPRTAQAPPLLDLPLEDIAQVEVLQGAAATARYGMQGTQGVILISTRRGGGAAAGPQPLRVRYAAWGGVQQVRQRYEVLDAAQYAVVANAAAAHYGRPAPFPAASLGSLPTTDWQEEAFRPAGIQSHNLSIDGAGQRTRYYAAADYLNQAGVLVGSGLSRYHLRANLDHQVDSRLTLAFKASASQADQRYAGDFDAGRTLFNVLRAAPTPRPDFPTFYNPLSNVGTMYHTPRTRRLLVQLAAAYQLRPGLQLSVRGSRELAEALELGYSAPYRNTPATSVETSTGKAGVRAWVADAALRYQHTFGQNHALSGTLAYQLQQFERSWGEDNYTDYSLSSSRFREKSHNIHSPSAAATYTYAGRYEALLSLRSDFILGVDGRAGAYYWSPGAQLSWHLHKEAWLAGSTGLSALTLWAGTGRTGTFVASQPFFSLTPPDRTTQHDAGLRLGLPGGRLALEATAYRRRTSQAGGRFIVPVDPSGQVVVLPLKELVLQNQGLSLSLGSSWRLGLLAGASHLALATNHNQVLSLQPLSTLGGLRGLMPLEEGRPVSRFMLYEQDGTYPVGSQRAGSVRLRDHDGDGSPDATYQGSGLPRHTLSFGQQLRLRRFQLDAQLDGLFGYQILNTTLAALDVPNGATNSSVQALAFWTPDNPTTNVPRAGTFSSLLSNQNLASGNHLRLTQLTLAFDVLSKGPRQASVWVGGQNLFVTGSYRGYDPNVSSGGASPMQAGLDASVYPVARVWQLGVRASF